MKTTLMVIGLLIGAVALYYFFWLAVIPMRIGETVVTREVTQNSIQYVQTQKTALVTMYTKYTEASGSAQRKAIKGQMCLVMASIPVEEVPSHIKGEIVCN